MYTRQDLELLIEKFQKDPSQQDLHSDLSNALNDERYRLPHLEATGEDWVRNDAKLSLFNGTMYEKHLTKDVITNAKKMAEAEPNPITWRLDDYKLWRSLITPLHVIEDSDPDFDPYSYFPGEVDQIIHEEMEQNNPRIRSAHMAWNYFLAEKFKFLREEVWSLSETRIDSMVEYFSLFSDQVTCYDDMSSLMTQTYGQEQRAEILTRCTAFCRKRKAEDLNTLVRTLSLSIGLCADNR